MRKKSPVLGEIASSGQALIQSTENQLSSIDAVENQPIYSELILRPVRVERRKANNPYVTTILVVVCSASLLVIVISVIILIDFYVLNLAKSSLTAANASKNTTNSTTAFRWKSCGQTNVKTNFSTLSGDYRAVSRRHKRIIGGENAYENAWPFLASLRIKTDPTSNKTEHHCGATLISDQYVITAAHCVLVYFKMIKHLNISVTQVFSLVEVQIGMSDHQTSDDTQPPDENVYGIEYFLVHDDFYFTSHTLHSDIALMKLKRRVNLNRPEVNTVCMPRPMTTSGGDGSGEGSPTAAALTTLPRQGDQVVVIGWGAYAEEFNYTGYIKDRVQQAVFTVRSSDDSICNSGHVGYDWDKSNTMCAHSDKEGDKLSTCYGDSGGPVLSLANGRWTILGIISFGHDERRVETNEKKCNASLPFYFVKVQNYMDWIQNVTQLKFDHVAPLE